MQSRLRCRLYVGSSMYDVTNDLMNWDDIYSKLKRVNYGGVMRSFAGKFEFVRKAREVIRKDLMDNMMYSIPKLIWYERDENWAWKEVFSYVLDISSYDDDGSVVSISAVDNSLDSLIKAKKGTQYEYSINAVKEDYSLFYDRIAMKSTVSYIPHSMDSNGDANIFCYYPTFWGQVTISIPFLVNGDAEIFYNDGLFEYESRYDMEDYPASNCFIYRVNRKTDIHIKGRFKIKIISGLNVSLKFALYKIVDNDSVSKIPLSDVYSARSNNEDSFTFNIDKTISVDVPYRNIMFIAEMYIPAEDSTTCLELSEFDDFSVSISTRATPVSIDVVSPAKLLSRLLRSMNGGADGLIGIISAGEDTRLDNCMIVAAESVRDLPEAKLYTSFNKYCSWMSAEFGFIYEIDGNTVRFVQRNSLYKREIVKVLGTDVSEFNCRTEPSLIYSQVNVGYDKQDYDSINGRDEFRFTTEYSTGITLTDNKLELISPYRSDAYGIEFLVQKRGENTTDKESDNDVFFVGAKLVRNQTILPGNVPMTSYRYELIRGGDYALSGVISPETMFNAMYSPRQMLMANKAFIGVSVDHLEYASSNGNSEVVINGVGEKESIIIERKEALFMPMSVEAQTSEQDLPDNRNGLISIEREGAVYRGFVDEIERFHGKSKSNSYKLILLDVVPFA